MTDPNAEPIRVVQVVWLDDDHVAVQHTENCKFEHFAVASATLDRAANKLQDQLERGIAPSEVRIHD